MSGTAYRGEIDGLRAISVLLIILFHLQVPRLSGGFIGVDVFFVISGFLITRIILEDLEGGRFSFKRFYVRRIARLLPALLVTILVSLLAAAVFLSPRGLVHSAQEGLAAVFSVSNIFFWLESNYWAPKAKNFLFLHTWSLGVEEQFYLLYPVLLFGAYRFFSNRGVVLLVVVMLVGGAVASQIMLSSDRAAAFYLTPLRFYEFAMGGLAALLSGLLPNKRLPGHVLSLGTLVGLALIFYSALTFSFFTRFPGMNALWPTLGAVLVILAGGSVAATLLLANPLMTWLGRLSYSLYLVHWPAIVLYRYYSGPSLELLDQFFLLLLTLLLATLLNRYVELPFRLTRGDRVTRSGMSAARSLRFTGLGLAVITILAASIMYSGGWPGRYPASVQALARADVSVLAREKRLFMEARCKPRGKVFCGKRQAESHNIMLLADSRGLDIYAALLSAYPGVNVYASYAMGCAPVFNAAVGKSTHFKDCPRLNRRRLAAALKAPQGDIVFLAMDLNAWRVNSVVETARRLVASGKQVYVLGESRYLRGKSPQAIAIDQSRFSSSGAYIERYLIPSPFRLDAEYDSRFTAVGAVYISTREFFYQDGYRLFTRKGDELLSYDGIHLSEAGAREFGEYLARLYPLDEE